MAYSHASLQRHATSSGNPYFDDSRTTHGLAAVLGLDAPLRIAPHVELLPTFRLLLNFGPDSQSSGAGDPVAAQTSAGVAVLRYGAGARFTFWGVIAWIAAYFAPAATHNPVALASDADDCRKNPGHWRGMRRGWLVPLCTLRGGFEVAPSDVRLGPRAYMTQRVKAVIDQSTRVRYKNALACSIP